MNPILIVYSNVMFCLIRFLSSLFQVIDLQNEMTSCRIRADGLMHQYEKSEKKIEQFWADEPNQGAYHDRMILLQTCIIDQLITSRNDEFSNNVVRAKFQKACEGLKNLTVEDYFAFRNHRVVPIFTQKIVDTISMLLKMPKVWKQQQLLYADR